MKQVVITFPCAIAPYAPLITEENFPHSVLAATELIANTPISSTEDEISFAIIEHISAKLDDGRMLSDEIDCLRWTFRAINGEWILLNCIQPLRLVTIEEENLLASHFLIAAREFAGTGRHLILEDNRFTAKDLYGFAWPVPSNKRIAISIPESLLERCKEEAVKQNLFETVTVNMLGLADH